MIDAAMIQRNLVGAWRVMTGRADGMRMLDISAEGFWDSFFAIVVATPALAIGWLSSANQFMIYEPAPSRLGLIMRLAAIDLSVWIVPLVGLALVARRAGIADRYVHYVVSGNWATALLIWLTLPPAIMRLLAPGTSDMADILMFVLFLAAQVFTWRQTNVSLNKGPVVATAVFFGILVAGLATLFVMQSLLGLEPPPQLPA
jgi:hypothetical protein